jgi:hypothetical protein
MNREEILTALLEQVEILSSEDAKASKVSSKRARSAANEVKKLAAEYKKVSLAESKA